MFPRPGKREKKNMTRCLAGPKKMQNSKTVHGNSSQILELLYGNPRLFMVILPKSWGIFRKSKTSTSNFPKILGNFADIPPNAKKQYMSTLVVSDLEMTCEKKKQHMSPSPQKNGGSREKKT